jgi:hypothetical protein
MRRLESQVVVSLLVARSGDSQSLATEYRLARGRPRELIQQMNR